MATAQPGIFAAGTRSHYHLEFDLRRDADAPPIAAALRALREPAVAAGGANLVVGFGADVWRRVAPPTDVPDGLAPFAAVVGAEGRTAPATQHDLWIWIHGTGEDIVLDTARVVAAVIEPIANAPALEQPCFVFKDSRDLTGFIDGTANPSAEEAPFVARVPDGSPGAGGSFVITQRWVHDLRAFDALAVPDQERVIGRTKPDSIEFDDDAKPANAHIARVEIADENGDELPIFRRSTPYGTVAKHGLYFVAFSADLARFDRMLANMFGTAGDGVHDRLVDFTSPETGSYYFAPSLEALDALLG